MNKQVGYFFQVEACHPNIPFSEVVTPPTVFSQVEAVAPNLSYCGDCRCHVSRHTPSGRDFGLLVGQMTASSFIDIVFTRTLGDQFIKVCLFSRPSSQDASETLDMLPHAAASGNHNGHVGIRDVHPFIEHFRGHQYRIVSLAKGLQEVFPFFQFSEVGEDGKKKKFCRCDRPFRCLAWK